MQDTKSNISLSLDIENVAVDAIAHCSNNNENANIPIITNDDQLEVKDVKVEDACVQTILMLKRS